MRKTITIAAATLALAACGPTFAPGWYPVINNQGVPVMGVDHPDTARRYGLAQQTVVECTGPGGTFTSSLADVDHMFPNAWNLSCRPAPLVSPHAK